VASLQNSEFSNGYELIIQNPGNKFEIHFINIDTLIDTSPEKTLGEALNNGVIDIEKKRYIQDKPTIVELKENDCLYYPKDVSIKRLDELASILQEEVKMIKELFELEPDNRFGREQLIYLLENFFEMHTNSPSLLKDRIELCEEIVKHSINLLEKNPRLAKRFGYFLTLYEFKLKAVKAIADGKKELIKEYLNQENMQQINLTELVDLLLIGGAKVASNEATPTLNLFH